MGDSRLRTGGQHQQPMFASTVRVGDEYGQDIKDTQHVSAPYEYANGHARPAMHAYDPKDSSPSMASIVRNVSSTLNKMTSPAANTNPRLMSKQSPSASSSSSKGFRLPTLPGASTVGFVFLCALWYLSSAFSSNTGKSILTRFRFPVTLTFVQFAFVAGYCVLFLAARERLSGGAAGSTGDHLSRRRSSAPPIGSWLHTLGIRKASRQMLKGTLVMSFFQIAGHVFSSMAIARVPVSTVHTIKALSPLFTVMAYAALFRVRYGSATYISLLPLTLGVMLACSFDLRANAVGFLCALGSALVFVSQNIFSKKLLPKENSSGAASAADSHKLDKLNLLFYSSGAAFFLMIPIWLYTDGSALFQRLVYGDEAAQNAGSTLSLLVFFFLNGTVHFAQNLLAFSILARTSPVTYSIASLIKRIAVICIAIVWSGQHVTFIQGFGMCLTFIGLWLYQRAKGEVEKGEKKRVQVERRHSMFLPVSAEDIKSLSGASTPEPQLLPHQNARLAMNGGQPSLAASTLGYPNGSAYSHSNSVNLGASNDDAGRTAPRNRTGSFPGSTGRPAPIVPPPPHSSNHDHHQAHAPMTTSPTMMAHTTSPNSAYQSPHMNTHMHMTNGNSNGNGPAQTREVHLSLADQMKTVQAKEVSPSRAGVYR